MTLHTHYTLSVVVTNSIGNRGDKPVAFITEPAILITTTSSVGIITTSKCLMFE